MKTAVVALPRAAKFFACILLVLTLAVPSVSAKRKKTQAKKTATPTPIAATPTPTPIVDPIVEIVTSKGTVYVKLYRQAAPRHTANFLELAAARYYENVSFHRVMRGVMAETGDRNTLNDFSWDDGRGGPGYSLAPELGLPVVRGSVVASRLPDQVNPKRLSNGSMFFICLTDLPMFTDRFSVFGEVVSGIEVLDRIAAVECDREGRPVAPVYIDVVSAAETAGSSQSQQRPR